MVIEHMNDLSGGSPGKVPIVLATEFRTSTEFTWVCTTFDNQRKLAEKLDASDEWIDVQSQFVRVYAGGAIR